MKKQHLTATNFDLTAKATIIGQKRTMLRRKTNSEQIIISLTMLRVSCSLRLHRKWTNCQTISAVLQHARHDRSTSKYDMQYWQAAYDKRYSRSAVAGVCGKPTVTTVVIPL